MCEVYLEVVLVCVIFTGGWLLMYILTLKFVKLDSSRRYSFYVCTSKFYVNDCCLVNNPYQDTKIKAGHVRCIIRHVGNISLPFGDYMNHDQTRFKQQCTFRSPRCLPPEKGTKCAGLHSVTTGI